MKWQNIAHNIKTIKISAIFVLLLFLFFSSNSFALGIGGIKLSSTLDKPLDANIELLDVSSDELSEIGVKLAPNAIYERMGIQRSALVNQLIFTIQEQDDGKHVIHISTQGPVTEPFLNFLIEVNWRNGRLLREFTVLLDPPIWLEEQASLVTAPETELPPTFSERTQIEEEPETVPPLVEVSPIDEMEEFESSAPKKTIPASDVAPVSDSADTQGVADLSSMVHTVQKNEYLWKIANEMRPQNISVDQMMLALQRANSEAFFGDTVSQLKTGAILRIDNVASLNSISVSDAIAEIARQNQKWLAYKRDRQARNAVSAESAEIEITNGEQTNSSVEESLVSVLAEETSLLKLVSPINEQSDLSEATQTNATQTNATLEAGESSLENLSVELAMASEDMEAKRLENEDLKDRLSSLQDQMSKAKNLIELKDNELKQFETGVEDEVISQILPSVELNEQTDIASENIPPVKANTDEVDQKKSKAEYWKDPVILGTTAGAALLLLLTIIVVKRKRKENQVEQEPEAIDHEDASLEELFAESEGSNNDTQVIKFNDSFLGEEESDISLEPLTELNFDTNENELLESREPFLDPIAEADVYLTYEKYGKAELLLNDAIQSEPDRQELKLKLLEVHALSHNVGAFNNAADILYASISGDDQHPIWQQAISLAMDIGSESPLFAKSEANVAELIDKEIQKENVDLPFGDEEILAGKDNDAPSFDANSPGKTSDIKENFSVADNRFDELLDSELFESFSANSDELKAAELEKLNLDSSESITEVLEFTDFDEIQTENESEVSNILSEREDVNDVEPKSILSINELGLDYDEDLELKPEKVTGNGNKEAYKIVEKNIADITEIDTYELPDDEQSITVDDVFDPVSHPISAGLTNEKEFTDTSLFLLSDEVGTKLDLAKAYMEMGDYDGAKDLLSEVMGEGNSKQQAEAMELLETT